MGHLLTRLQFPLEIDYIHATRYGKNTYGSELFWKVKPNLDLNDRYVLIIDDILDGGVTLAAIVNEIQLLNPTKIYTGVLVNKQRVREDRGLQEADFVGLNIENKYVFGYGLDYKQYLRNAAGIYVVPDAFM